MKFEPHKWPLVRYFRRPATSVPPKWKVPTPKTGLEIARNNASDTSTLSFDTDTIGDQIVKQLLESGVLMSHVSRAHPQAERAGIKPPLDSGTNDWTWSQWSKEAAGAGTIPGWAFCRFANRLGSESVGFVFGHVRGGFGVWRQPFDVCTSDHDGVQQRSEILTCVTHLHSGMGVGIFIDHATAIMAAELAEKVCPPGQGASWFEGMGRARIAWHGIGITESINANAHDQHGTRFPIYGQDTESVMAGKPERLS